MYDPMVIEAHRAPIRKMASEGMVLLKNDFKHLPLAKNSKIALFGRNQIDFFKGGLGSGDVFCGSVVNLLEALENEEKSFGTISLDKNLVAEYRSNLDYIPTEDAVKKSSENSDYALWVIGRNSTEGLDRYAKEGDFYLSKSEKDLLKLFEKYFDGRVIVVLNICGVISLAELSSSSAVSAILYAGLPGMEGGNALVDVLIGRVNPSGRLVDTFCGVYDDYPSSSILRSSKFQVDYEEDIFVGYRYFESAESEKSKVIYPFGHGLSYTEFKTEVKSFETSDAQIKAVIKVSNIGQTAGKISLALYSTPIFNSKVERCAVELKSFGKTPLLEAGTSCELVLEFSTEELAFFDEKGDVAIEGSWVIEKGEYLITCGGSVRERFEVGTFSQKSDVVLSSPGLKFVREMSAKRRPGKAVEKRNLITDIQDKGLELEVVSSFINYVKDDNLGKEFDEKKAVKKVHTLYDVADGKVTMDEFLDQLSDRELVGLCQAKFPTFPHGTAGIGNMREYGIPNPQTADGPAGVRLAVATSCFPCETLLAQSWDIDNLFLMGKIMGEEALNTGIDIMLAPGMNLHRDPLCGRNFEYYSEDPMISGYMAAYMVRGLQSTGVSATLKHFAANNKEEYRFYSSSVVSERALREIYLKNFEYAIKIGKPNCIMSSYNLINWIKVSCCYNLLTGVLRDEWGYEGFVMTDWRNDSNLWQELLAGNDAKMPFGYPEELEMALARLDKLLPREVVRKSAARILRVIMTTPKFKNHDFGTVFELGKDKELVINANELSEISCNITRLEESGDGGLNHTRLCKDQRDKDVYIIYRLNVREAGTYAVGVRTATTFDTVSLEVTVDDESCGLIKVANTGDWQKYQTTGQWQMDLTEGEHELKLYTRATNASGFANIGRVIIHAE